MGISFQARMTVLDYAAQIGGLLGLFIGFSVISAIEIIYWLTLRLMRNKCQSQDQEFATPAFYDPPQLPPKIVNKAKVEPVDQA